MVNDENELEKIQLGRLPMDPWLVSELEKSISAMVNSASQVFFHIYVGK